MMFKSNLAPPEHAVEHISCSLGSFFNSLIIIPYLFFFFLLNVYEGVWGFLIYMWMMMLPILRSFVLRWSVCVTFEILFCTSLGLKTIKHTLPSVTWCFVAPCELYISRFPIVMHCCCVDQGLKYISPS